MTGKEAERMLREDLAWEMIRRVYNGNDKGLTPLEKIEYDRQRTI